MSSKPNRKVNFNVSEEYEVLDVIGEGAYGVVWYVDSSFAEGCKLMFGSSAVHKPTGQKVAIKKITPFDHSMFCLRTLREMKLLRYFNHENVRRASICGILCSADSTLDHLDIGHTEACRL